jgi:hypothetical protein
MTMKRILLFILLIAVLSNINVSAQCDNRATESAPGDNDATPASFTGALGATPYGTLANLSTASFPGGYIYVDNALSGQTYNVSIDVSSTYLTIRQGGTVLASYT